MVLTPEMPKSRRQIRLSFLLETLEREWDEMDEATWQLLQSGAWQGDLLAYYHACVRTALFWVDGDPYTRTFPAPYRDERLARLCTFLLKLEGADARAVGAERDRQVSLLRDHTWPAYVRECGQMGYPGTGVADEEFSYSTAGIDIPWGELDFAGPAGNPPSQLPTFHSRASEAFHCNALAVLYLNRATKRPLADLDITPV